MATATKRARRNGALYSALWLPTGGFGIYVEVWRNGVWLETDRNSTPWPTIRVALEHARRAAEAAAERYGVPVTAFAS